jgi:nucleoside-diphosphate-sugar epimerase
MISGGVAYEAGNRGLVGSAVRHAYEIRGIDGIGPAYGSDFESSHVLPTVIYNFLEAVAEVIGFDGEIVWDTSKPDGPPRKLLDVSRLRGLGWELSISLREDITCTHEWWLEHG